MFSQMILDKVHEVQEIGKGNTPCIVAIDKGGSILLGVPHRPRITQKKTNFKGISYVTRYLPINYKHINGINQTEVETILFCDEKGHDLVRWELEVSTIFQYNNEEIKFIPDVFVEIRFGEKNFLSFIEYDTGSEDHRNKNHFPTIYNKLINYNKYKTTKLWEDQYEYFPMILFVTEDSKRIQWFNNHCKEFGLRGLGVYYENYTDVLRRLAEMA